MRLATPTPKTRSKRRKRYAVPPRLWVTLFVTSVAVHLLLIVAVQSQFGASTSGDLAAIDIEFISEDELATESQPARSASRAVPVLPDRPAPSVPASPESQSVPEVEPSTTTDLSPSSEEPSPQPDPITPSPSPQPNPITPSPDPVTPANDPVTPEPRQPEPTSENPENSPTPPSPSPVTPTEPARSGMRLPDPSDPRWVPPNGLGQAPSEPTDQTRVSQQPIPASFSATIGTATLPTGLPDIPENPATLRDSDRSRTFESNNSGCSLTPEALRSFGQEVIVRVVVDAKGDIYTDPEPFVPKPGDNPDYDKLAICVVKTWKFNPAYDMKEGKPSERFSELDVGVVIN